MPRHERPRRLSDAELLHALVDEIVTVLCGADRSTAFLEALWREGRKRQLVGHRHGAACVCQNCVADWIEGIHDGPEGPF